MRCFLGLDLDANSKLAIEAWREKALPPFEKPVPAANFHVTSVFLGQVTPVQLEPVLADMDNLDVTPFSMQFNMLGYWSKPAIFWLGCTHPHDSAGRLAQWLSSCVKRHGLSIENRPYVPHITLVRKARAAPPTPLFPPDFTLRFDTVHLFESVSGQHGVRYESRERWHLPLR